LIRLISSCEAVRFELWLVKSRSGLELEDENNSKFSFSSFSLNNIAAKNDGCWTLTTLDLDVGTCCTTMGINAEHKNCNSMAVSTILNMYLDVRSIACFGASDGATFWTGCPN
jgi:hypothetical protein